MIFIHFKMVEAVGLKIIAWRHHLHTRFYENLPVGSKDICRSFTPEASNAFRSFLPYSKQLLVVFMVISLPLCRFCPAVKYMPFLP
jgi:hypothetical protein